MAQLNQPFDSSQHKATTSFEPVPANWYTAMITESEDKVTNAGDGHYIAFTLNIIEGPYVNRKLFTNLNYDNPNPTARDIANGHLSSLCNIAGIPVLVDTEALHGIPMMVKVKVVNDEVYGPSNDISGFKACDNVIQNTIPPAFAQQVQPPGPPGAVPPPPPVPAQQPAQMAPPPPPPPGVPQTAPAQVAPPPQTNQPAQYTQPAPAPQQAQPVPVAPVKQPW